MNYPHLLTIEQQSSTTDTAGEKINSWSTFATAFSQITPLQGRELALAKEMHADISSRIDTRYVAGITPAMRITKGARIFNILSVINVEERSRYLQIFCREIVG